MRFQLIALSSLFLSQLALAEGVRVKGAIGTLVCYLENSDMNCDTSGLSGYETTVEPDTAMEIGHEDSHHTYAIGFYFNKDGEGNDMADVMLGVDDKEAAQVMLHTNPSTRF